MKKLKLQYVYHTSDGELCLFINGVKYSYFLDSAIILKIIKQIEKKSGTVLNKIKKLSRSYYKHE